MARTDENPYDPPALPTFEDVIDIQGGYPQPQWPEDVILPDNKDRMEDQPPVDAAPPQPVPIPPPLPDHIPRPETQPEPEANMDAMDGELLAQNSLMDKAQQAADKIEALVSSPQEGAEIGANAAAALSAASGDIERSGGLGGQLGDESIMEARTDEVHDAETVPTEGSDGDIAGTFKDAFHALGEIGGKVQAAVEAARHDTANDDAVVETQADDVYEAEAAPVEASDDSDDTDPYDTDN